MVVTSLSLVTGCADNQGPAEQTVSTKGRATVPDYVIDSDLSDQVLPEEGIIYIVTLDRSKSRIELEYNNVFQKSLTSADFEGRRVEFENWLKNYVSKPISGKKLKKRCPKIGSPTSSGKPCTAVDNALSASNNKKAFIAFVLDQNIINWRYIQENREAPTDSHQYEDEVIKIGYDSDKRYYGNLKKIDSKGNIYKRDQNCSENNQQICNKNIVGAYVLANGDRRAADANYDYRDSFNLYVEVVDRDDQGIPLIIDPDVRWPGGNEP